MKKQTKITQDDRQTRATIPREFVDEFKITKKDEVEWESRRNQLKGKLVKNIADKFKFKKKGDGVSHSQVIKSEQYSNNKRSKK